MSLFRRRRGGRGEGDEPLADPAGDLSAEDAEFMPENGEAADMSDVGPYDVEDAPDDGLERLDLGSLKIPALSGVEVQIQANDDGQIAAVALIAGSSAVQVGAFAAPRSEGIWDEVREELAESLKAEGGTVTETDGEYGVELQGRIKAPNGTQDVRFVGFDGPRWFVRAVFHGAVATDASAAPQLVDCLRQIVVDRGKDPMPVREPLPLELPPEAVEAQQHATGGSGAEDTRTNGASRGRDQGER